MLYTYYIDSCQFINRRWWGGELCQRPTINLLNLWITFLWKNK